MATRPTRWVQSRRFVISTKPIGARGEISANWQSRLIIQDKMRAGFAYVDDV